MSGGCEWLFVPVTDWWTDQAVQRPRLVTTEIDSSDPKKDVMK